VKIEALVSELGLLSALGQLLLMGSSLNLSEFIKFADVVKMTGQCAPKATSRKFDSFPYGVR